LDVEHLVCSLKDWHGVGDVVDGYSLLGIDCLHLDIGVVFRPIATWGKMLHCPHQYHSCEEAYKAAMKAAGLPLKKAGRRPRSRPRARRIE
jgi:hypothetical protein